MSTQHWQKRRKKQKKKPQKNHNLDNKCPVESIPTKQQVGFLDRGRVGESGEEAKLGKLVGRLALERGREATTRSYPPFGVKQYITGLCSVPAHGMAQIQVYSSGPATFDME